jgi:HAE1 family hydrophobic/amphiphilic exporter-1
MGGIVGRFMSSFGLTASAAIAVSLLVSFTLTPMLAARLQTQNDPLPASTGSGAERRRRRGARQRIAHRSVRFRSGRQCEDDETARDANTPASERREYALDGEKGSKESRWYRPIDRTYKWMLEWSMAHRWVIVGLCVLVIISIVPLFMFVGKTLPVDDQSQFEVTVRAPEGNTIAATLRSPNASRATYGS